MRSRKTSAALHKRAGDRNRAIGVPSVPLNGAYKGDGNPHKGTEDPNRRDLTLLCTPKRSAPLKGTGFPYKRVRAPRAPSQTITLPPRDTEAHPGPQAPSPSGRVYLIAALLLAHLAVPPQLLQSLGFNPVGDGLGAEEIRLPHGGGDTKPVKPPKPPPPPSRPPLRPRRK